MKIYEMTFRLLSPAIVTRRRTLRGFLKPLDHIPSSTIRGAVIAHLYRRGDLDEEALKEEASAPRIIASPGYLTSRGERSYPCHPFAYRCKACEDGEVNYASEALETLEREGKPLFKSTCERGHLALKPLHPAPVIPKGDRLERVSPIHHSAVCVGMSRDRASSHRGLLFDYEALAVGLEFWATLVIPEKFSKGVYRGMKLRIGRGVSRGFGLAEVTKLRYIKLKEEAERVSEAFRGRKLILYALSPTSRAVGRGSIPRLSEMDLGEVAERCGLEVEGRLIFKAGYGRMTQLQTGYDMRRGVIRPRMKAGRPGCIYVAEVEGRGELEEAIAALHFLGTIEEVGGHPIPGLNLLTPLRGHPMAGGG